MRTLIIVPAYNEEESLPGVLADIRSQFPAADVLVVNDGSKDGTLQVARNSGINVLNLPFNLGIGGAMQAGYLYATAQGYDITIQFDGDGQHLALEIPKLLEPLEQGRADIVVGSRFIEPSGYRAPIFRRIGIAIFSIVLSRILGNPLTDTTSGFRAANRKVTEYFSRSYPEDYPEVEALVMAHRSGFRIAEVPVSMRGRIGGQTSINAARSVYYMVKVLLAVFIDLLKKRR